MTRTSADRSHAADAALAAEYAEAGIPLPNCDTCRAYLRRKAWALLATAAMVGVVAKKRTGQMLAVHVVQYHHHGHIEGWWRKP